MTGHRWYRIKQHQSTNFKPWLTALALYLCLASAAGAAPPGDDNWQRFTAEFIDSYFAAHPDAAIKAGRHEYDGQLPDWSAEAFAARTERLKQQRARAQAFERQPLNRRQSLEKKQLLSLIDSELFWVDRARWPYRNPYYYADALDPNVYISREYAPLERRLNAYIAYAEKVPAAVDQIRSTLQPPLAKPLIDIGINIVEGLTQFYAADVPVAFQPALNNSGPRKRFERANRQAQEALVGFARWLKTQRARGHDRFALGPKLFQEMLYATERLSMKSETIERAVRVDLERNRTALQSVCRSFAPHRTLAQCVAKARQNKPEDVLEAARQQLAGLKQFVAGHELVSIPPASDPQIAASPPYQRWNPASIDIPGPFDKDLPAIYFVSPPDSRWTAAERNAYLPSRPELLFISIHEVWPGHFLHFLHANRNPSPLARLFVSYGFAEGWAHYSEELMWEAGLNWGDAATHIGQLLNALLRDVRCLAGFGLHTHGMRIEQAERMFIEQAFLDQANARQQARRGTFDPEYVKYTLGKLMIRTLREEWTKRRGGRKSWKAFHDQLLSYGGPPLPLVREAMLGDPSGAPL